MSGDAARSSAVLLPELIEAGLRVLVYAGDAGEYFAPMPRLHADNGVVSKTYFVQAW